MCIVVQLSAVHLVIAAECGHQVVCMCFVRFAVSLQYGHTRCFGLLQEVECLGKSELHVLNAGIQVLLSAEASCILEQRDRCTFAFVLHHGVRIDGSLCRFAVLLALVNHNRMQTQRFGFLGVFCLGYLELSIDIHFFDCFLGGFLQTSETGIKVAVQEQGHFYRFVGIAQQILGGFAQTIVAVVRQIPTHNPYVCQHIDQHHAHCYYDKITPFHLFCFSV